MEEGSLISQLFKKLYIHITRALSIFVKRLHGNFRAFNPPFITLPPREEIIGKSMFLCMCSFRWGMRDAQTWLASSCRLSTDFLGSRERDAPRCVLIIAYYMITSPLYCHETYRSKAEHDSSIRSRDSQAKNHLWNISSLVGGNKFSSPGEDLLLLSILLFGFEETKERMKEKKWMV